MIDVLFFGAIKFIEKGTNDMTEATGDKLKRLFGDIQNRLNWFAPSQLGESMGVASSTVTRAIRRLEVAGWKVRKRRDGNVTLYNVQPKEYFENGDPKQNTRGKVGANDTRQEGASKASRRKAKEKATTDGRQRQRKRR